MGDMKTARVRSPLLMWNQNCHKVVEKCRQAGAIEVSSFSILAIFPFCDIYA